MYKRQPSGRISVFKSANSNCLSDEIVKNFEGNAECKDTNSRGGAGGYTSGIIKITKKVTAYATIGGQGTYGCIKMMKNNESCYLKENMVKGGYGYGGYGANYYNTETTTGSGSGGGQTSIQLEENDLWHRVIVSGGGGAAESPDGTYLGSDDGSGGSGGGIVAQGWWKHGNYFSEFVANSTSGFSFGYGESAELK